MPTSTPGGAAWRSAVLTQPSSSTRVHSPERPSTRSGAEGASVPAGGPSGARYSTVRRADSRRERSTGADEPVVVSGALTPGRRPGVGAAPAGVAATSATSSTSPFSTQPLRVTWIQLSVEPSATRVSRKRSEEHTSELQSRENLVCRLLLEKKKKKKKKKKYYKKKRKKKN